ncbi:MAG: hypothetical protein ACOC90_02070 [Bacteroidota bacterium]
MEALQISLHRDDIPWFKRQIASVRPGAWNHKKEEYRHFLFYPDCGEDPKKLKSKLEKVAGEHGKTVHAFITKKKQFVCKQCGKTKKIQGLSFVESCEKCGNREFDLKEVS